MIATPANAPVLRFRISGIIARSRVGGRLYGAIGALHGYAIVRASEYHEVCAREQHASFAFFNPEDLNQLNDLTPTDYKFRIIGSKEPRSCSKKNY